MQQEPKPQGKLITAISGEIFDVAVDLREHSPYFMKYISKKLTSVSNESIWVPPGFAHGFLSLSENSIILNRWTNEISPSLERGVRWDDPTLKIKWPTAKPILSEKDKKWPLLGPHTV